MSQLKDYFFCGVGGSGMTPLALIIQASGGRVEGSDRALDQGRNTERFDYLRARRIIAGKMAVRGETLGMEDDFGRAVRVERFRQPRHSLGNFRRHARSRRDHADPAPLFAHPSWTH